MNPVKFHSWLRAAGLLALGVAAISLTAAFAAAQTVSTGTAMVNGQKETVLTDAQGMTLYYNSQDRPGKVTCTGTCAKYWPPLLVPSGAPTGPASLQGGLTVFAGPLGRQVEYHGHPLYRFKRDKKPGEAMGQGLLHGRWQVATPVLPAATPPMSR